jgi:outer membrane lipoprotein SlyB
MARPLKIDSSSSPVSVKEMSDADYDYLTHTILSNFASSSTGVGTLSSTSSYTLVGTFSDTYRPYSVGQHPVGTDVTTVTYNFYQDLGSATETLTRPVHYDSGTKQQDDTTLNTTVITNVLANLVNYGLGSYSLSPTTPIGGTWTSQRTIQNTTSAANNYTYLWRKTSATAPSTVRPLKLNTTSPVSVKEMSDVEIQTLTDRVRNRIVSTGIGQYRVQSSAPVSGGTWVTRGSAFSDTRETTSTQSYSGTYTGGYSGTYTGNYNNAFSGSYSGNYIGTYTGNYTGSYTGSYSRAFAGAYAGTYVLYYAGFVGGYFTGYYTGYYTGTFTGSYSGSYSGGYTGTYTGSYTGSYTGTFTGNYTGNYSGGYSGSYSGLTVDATTENISSVSLWIRTA